MLLSSGNAQLPRWRPKTLWAGDCALCLLCVEFPRPKDWCEHKHVHKVEFCCSAFFLAFCLFLAVLTRGDMGSGASKVSRVAPARHRSVVVLWDVENCSVPSNMSGSDAVSAIRRWLEYKGWPSQPPDSHIVTAYNIFSNRVQPNFWNQLKHAGVEQIAAGPKHESADRELEQRMRREVRLLPQSEEETCFVLISADMDYLATVRDLLRGRVSVLWIHSSAVRLGASTLRQLEEATRPSTVREPRPISELTTWEQVLASGLGGGSIGKVPGAHEEVVGVINKVDPVQQARRRHKLSDTGWRRELGGRQRSPRRVPEQRQ